MQTVPAQQLIIFDKRGRGGGGGVNDNLWRTPVAKNKQITFEGIARDIGI